jgi:hypothetical protein
VANIGLKLHSNNSCDNNNSSGGGAQAIRAAYLACCSCSCVSLSDMSAEKMEEAETLLPVCCLDINAFANMRIYGICRYSKCQAAGRRAQDRASAKVVWICFATSRIIAH